MHSRVARVAFVVDDGAVAAVEMAASLSAFERAAALAPGEVRGLHDLVGSHLELGIFVAAQGKIAEAVTQFRAGLAIAEPRATGTAPVDPPAEWHDQITSLRMELGIALGKAGDAAGAMAVFGRDPVGAPEADGQRAHDLAMSGFEAAFVLVNAGDQDGATRQSAAALASAQAAAARQPGNRRWRSDLAAIQALRATRSLVQKDAAAAVAGYLASLEVAQRLVDEEPGDPATRLLLFRALSYASIGYRQLGDTGQAEAYAARAAAAKP